MEQSIRTAAAAGSGWHFISPNEAGFTSDLEARFDEAIAEKRVWNLGRHCAQGEPDTRAVLRVRRRCARPPFGHYRVQRRYAA